MIAKGFRRSPADLVRPRVGPSHSRSEAIPRRRVPAQQRSSRLTGLDPIDLVQALRQPPRRLQAGARPGHHPGRAPVAPAFPPPADRRLPTVATLRLTHRSGTGWPEGAPPWLAAPKPIRERLASNMLTELAGAVRERRVSARELVAASLDRVDRLDPALNSVVRLRGEEALREAQLADDRLARGEELGPLAGLPLLVKDIEDVAGLPTTHGSLLLRDAAPAVEDGLVPGRLRAAGAIVIGKTNTPEFATEGYTANRLFGVTRSPWARNFSPGGSSGGSGAALCAGLAPLATATDGGGSIRIPAAYCGLVGLKPTNGIVGRSPIPPWIDFSTDGPLATSVADLRLLLALEAGPVPGDPSALPQWRPGTGGRASRVLAAPRLAPWGPLPSEVDGLFEVAIRQVEEGLGYRIGRVEPEVIFRVGNIDRDWFLIAGPEQAHQLGRKVLLANEDKLFPAFRDFVAQALAVPIEEYLGARRRRFVYVSELDALLGDDTLLLTPTMALAEIPADGVMPGATVPGLPEDAYNTNAQNMTGHPALSVPAGHARSGVPFGLQVTGPRFRDDLVLDFGSEWERAFPWPLAAPPYTPFTLETL